MGQDHKSVMTKERAVYHAYLLRLWQTKTGWRASLEHPHTGERLGFASLEQLFVFLQDQTRDDERNRPQSDIAEK